jgi:hypothetical protein
VRLVVRRMRQHFRYEGRTCAGGADTGELGTMLLGVLSRKHVVNEINMAARTAKTGLES